MAADSRQPHGSEAEHLQLLTFFARWTHMQAHCMMSACGTGAVWFQQNPVTAAQQQAVDPLDELKSASTSVGEPHARAHLASSTLSDTVSAAAAPQRRAVVFRAPPSSASEPPHAQLLRRELRLDD
jgi:hypothetical protein